MNARLSGLFGGDASEHTRDAMYTALGFAILGLQRFQYHRREVGKALAANASTLSEEQVAEINGVADVVDGALGRWSGSAPRQLGEAASFAQSLARHLREQHLTPWLAQSDHSGETVNTETSTTSVPATDDT